MMFTVYKTAFRLRAKEVAKQLRAEAGRNAVNLFDLDTGEHVVRFEAADVTEAQQACAAAEKMVKPRTAREDFEIAWHVALGVELGGPVPEVYRPDIVHCPVTSREREVVNNFGVVIAKAIDGRTAADMARLINAGWNKGSK